MGLISFSTITDGTTATASQVNTPLTTIYDEFNGNITNANIATGAGIATAKLASDAGIVNAMIADATVASEKLNATIACRVYRNAALNITSSGTKITFDTENFDLGDDFDVANSRFVAPVTGYYQVNLTASVSNLDAGGQIYVEIYVNGAAYSRSRDISVASTDDPSASVSDLVPVTAGQYIEGYATTTTTEAIQTGSVANFMSIYFVGV